MTKFTIDNTSGYTQIDLDAMNADFEELTADLDEDSDYYKSQCDAIANGIELQFERSLALVKKFAIEDGTAFYNEFFEVIDTQNTDWDAVAWEQRAGDLKRTGASSAKVSALWEHYVKCLTEQTELLCLDDQVTESE